MEGRSGAEEVSYKLLRLVMTYMNMDRQMQNYGTDTVIYHSEIHLISAIAKNADINVKGLAEQFGITSASVSETLSKLQKKGLIKKTQDEGNLSRLKLSLTTKGRLAHEEHMRYHDEINQIIAEALTGATEEQLDFLIGFCNGVRTRMEDFKF